MLQHLWGTSDVWTAEICCQQLAYNADSLHEIIIICQL